MVEHDRAAARGQAQLASLARSREHEMRAAGAGLAALGANVNALAAVQAAGVAEMRAGFSALSAQQATLMSGLDAAAAGWLSAARAAGGAAVAPRAPPPPASAPPPAADADADAPPAAPPAEPAVAWRPFADMEAVGSVKRCVEEYKTSLGGDALSMYEQESPGWKARRKEARELGGKQRCCACAAMHMRKLLFEPASVSAEVQLCPNSRCTRHEVRMR